MNLSTSLYTYGVCINPVVRERLRRKEIKEAVLDVLRENLLPPLTVLGIMRRLKEKHICASVQDIERAIQQLKRSGESISIIVTRTVTVSFHDSGD